MKIEQNKRPFYCEVDNTIGGIVIHNGFDEIKLIFDSNDEIDFLINRLQKLRGSTFIVNAFNNKSTSIADG